MGTKKFSLPFFFFFAANFSSHLRRYAETICWDERKEKSYVIKLPLLEQKEKQEKPRRKRAQQVRAKFIIISYLQFFNIKNPLPHHGFTFLFCYHRSTEKSLQREDWFVPEEFIVKRSWTRACTGNSRLVPQSQEKRGEREGNQISRLCNYS